jgi:uncharacterized cupredoxin-like copper-binding protein
VRRSLSLLLLFTLITLFGSTVGDASADHVTIAIRYSHFTPGLLTVHAGEPVTITLRNDDPIEHEWIVGTPAVQERHRTGTEAVHDQIPTEVTIPSFSTRTTTITFEKAAILQYICHMPGHEAYGMVGTLRVLGP